MPKSISPSSTQKPRIGLCEPVWTAAQVNVLVNDVIDTRAVIVNVKSTCVTTTVSFAATGQTWFDFTGLSATITPSSNTSKILVFGHVSLGASVGNLLYAQIVRDSTAIGIGTSVSSRSAVHTGGVNVQPDTNASVVLPINFLDSPATTSAITYKVQVKSHSTLAFYGNRTSADIDANYSARSVSTITVMEVPV